MWKDAQLQLIHVSKVLLMTFVLSWSSQSKKQMDILFLVTAFSFGALAIKGTLFGLATGGNFRIWGPRIPLCTTTNDFGLARQVEYIGIVMFSARPNHCCRTQRNPGAPNAKLPPVASRTAFLDRQSAETESSDQEEDVQLFLDVNEPG